jgi:hypothetical protein
LNQNYIRFNIIKNTIDVWAVFIDVWGVFTAKRLVTACANCGNKQKQPAFIV